VLHQVVRNHLETFLAEVRLRGDGQGVPRFVERELREFLSCGVLARGFARFRCGDCQRRSWLPFPARGAASARRVAADAWPSVPRTWWTASWAACPCASGCSPYRTGCATRWRGITGSVALPIADFGMAIADCVWSRNCTVTRAEAPRSMTKDELKQRTRRFALDVIRLVESLPRSRTTEVVGRQLLRSATSVAANYRAACRAKSAADFVAKMGIVEEEADESMYWMDLLVESGSIAADRVDALLREANELLAITVSSIKTARVAKDRLR
jgi:four helix bundle protein